MSEEQQDEQGRIRTPISPAEWAEDQQTPPATRKAEPDKPKPEATAPAKKK